MRSNPQRIIPALILLTTLSSCRSIPSGSTIAPAPAVSPDMRVAGRIERVNDDFGFVVVRCNIAPLPESIAEIYSQGKAVGRIRFSDRSTHPYYSADLISGSPRKGDLAVCRE